MQKDIIIEKVYTPIGGGFPREWKRAMSETEKREQSTGDTIKVSELDKKCHKVLLTGGCKEQAKYIARDRAGKFQALRCATHRDSPIPGGGQPFVSETIRTNDPVLGQI